MEKSLIGFLVGFLFAGMVLAQERVPGEYLVKYYAPVSSALEAQNIIEEVSAEQNLYLVKKPVVEGESGVLDALTLDPGVELIEPNYIYRANDAPNDSHYSAQWSFHGQGTNCRGQAISPQTSIQAERAWARTQGSKSVVVAVIDTGIDPTIADLKDNLWVNQAEQDGETGKDDDGNGFIDDVHGYDFVSGRGDVTDDQGHGSHCAGVIGARGNNGQDLAGVNWQVSLMAVKFLDANGSGTLANAVKAIDYAVANGAKVLSNSWGGGGYSELLKQSIERANAKGILFVAAAGNSASNNDQTASYPATYQIANVVSVASLSGQGALSAFANYGAQSVHLTAPGENIISTTPQGLRCLSGSSMATPHVSGAAALALSVRDSLTAAELKDLLQRTATPLAPLAGRVKSGGNLNVGALIEAL